MPEPMKRQLLDKIRDQIGYTNYNGAVDAVGEDGVIDAVLSSMTGESSSSSSTSSSSGASSKSGGGVGSRILDLLAANWWWIAMCLIAGGGPVGVAIGIGTIVIVLAIIGYNAITSHMESTSYTYGSTYSPYFHRITVAEYLGVLAVGAVAIGVLALLVWKCGPWLWHGSQQWWVWLGEHFRGPA